MIEIINVRPAENNETNIKNFLINNFGIDFSCKGASQLVETFIVLNQNHDKRNELLTMEIYNMVAQRINSKGDGNVTSSNVERNIRYILGRIKYNPAAFKKFKSITGQTKINNKVFIHNIYEYMCINSIIDCEEGDYQYEANA